MDRQQQFLRGLGLAGALSVLIALPAKSEIAQVTNVRVNPTSSGLEVILETADGKPLQVFSYSYGETFVADVITTQLRLPAGNAFRQDNPAPGITSIEVIPLDTYSIRVIVTGETGVPTAQVSNSKQGLVLSLNPGTETTAQQPAPTRPTRPSQQPSIEGPPAPIPTPPSGQQPTLPTIPTSPDTEPETETPIPRPSPDAGEPDVQTPSTPPSREPGAEIPPLPSTGPDSTQTEAERPVDLIVTATRTAEEVEDVPRSVTVIEREQIEEQATFSRNLPDILGQTVPGLGAPNQSYRSFGQSLRGRRPLVLIDGVPVSTNLSTAYVTELRSIDPSAIERVEVIRGPSAVYGEGATGGVINIITRSPGEEGITSTIQADLTNSLSHIEDSFGSNVVYGISGRQGNVDFTTSASVVKVGGVFDAEGDRIPLAEVDASDSTTINLLGKVGLDITDEQRIQLTFNHFRDTQEVKYVTDPAVDEDEDDEKARALRRNLQFIGVTGPQNLNTVATLDYSNQDIFGSRVQAQAYFRHNASGGAYFDNRIFEPESPTDVVNSRQETERLGGRLQIDTPFSEAASLLWGVDYVNEDIAQTFQVFDPEEFDASGGTVLRKIGERVFVPPYEVNNLGLFAQAQWDVSEQFLLSGGLRHERIGLSVNDYITSEDQPIEGGDRDFDATVFNAGLVYKATEEVSFFTNFAQGFSIPDFGRILRRPPEGFVAVNSDLQVTEPIKTNNYELGIRGQWSQVQVSLAGFYNTSKLGSTLQEEENGRLQIVRAPQRIYGAEATVDWQPTDTWQLGGTASWTEGESDDDEDGEYLALDSSNIQPIKLTAYIENQTTPGWSNRLQLLFSGNRSAGFEAGLDGAPIESYITVDYLSSIQIGRGTLQIGVQNLLNEQYSTVQSQWLGGFLDSLDTAARGRTVTVGYSLSF
ncbi:MAG: TonB-dependent receptor [Microcoleus vaginatus WJT46-NPBG5]|jgi:iron complex outermembrane receptor protein|nr:TonB-dependent receptor [Microcoleus vaginatus WJT46-NPBG5]